MVRRADITEKPEIIWENPDLGGQFARLGGRSSNCASEILRSEGKLGLISSFSHNLLGTIYSTQSSTDRRCAWSE